MTVQLNIASTCAYPPPDIVKAVEHRGWRPDQVPGAMRLQYCTGRCGRGQLEYQSDEHVHVDTYLCPWCRESIAAFNRTWPTERGG